MEKETISKLLGYYFESPQFKEEVLRALRKFFDRPDLGPGKKLEIQEKEEEMFNEWFIFDFKLKNGKTPLEDFYERNPYNFNTIRLQIYKDLQDNHLGFYKVKEVRLGEGLRLENLQTGKIYEVREFAATFGLKKEQVFSARVGKAGDHYELVGANPGFGPVKLNFEMEQLFRKSKKKWNPKIIKNYFLASEGASGQPEEYLSLEEYPSLEEVEEKNKNKNKNKKLKLH